MVLPLLWYMVTSQGRDLITSETLRDTVRVAPRTINSSTAKAFRHSLAAAGIELRGLADAALVLRNDTRYSCDHKLERFICNTVRTWLQ